jgi:Zn-dependent M28 family amino/carboxypeptidase
MKMTVPSMVTLLALALTVSSCNRGQASETSSLDPPSAPLTIDGQAVLEHIKVLASDAYEGRFPGTRGEDLTVAYLTDQFKRAGLKPGNSDGTYIQRVPLAGITPDPSMTITFAKGGQEQQLRFKDDFVAWTKRFTGSVSLNQSELVFVGYGVVAPEYEWDDYKGLDLRDKTLVVLINDPPVPDPSDPLSLDPNVFGGAAMTYYGRYTYKFEIAAQKGAAGVLIVHETVPAGYPFAALQGTWTAEQFTLSRPDKNMSRLPLEGWITVDQGRRLFELAGQDFDALHAQAATRAFKPVALGVTASVEIRNTLRTVESRNVLGRLEGSDPRLTDEFVIYMAHWDHLGIGPEVNGDRIYNGAQDNASGTGGLIEIARAFSRLAPRPKRSVLFLAVTAEEQGLLGSEYYATNPTYPLVKTLAAINMDGLNLYGRIKSVRIIGAGYSELDDYVRDAAVKQQRLAKPDEEPQNGSYYRSDHLSFAKQGVPALYVGWSVDYIGKPPNWGPMVVGRYRQYDYHRPSDEVKPEWNLNGTVEDLLLLANVGYRVAQASRYPRWKPPADAEFRARRDAQLKAAGSR